jgi:hypothetical protein
MPINELPERLMILLEAARHEPHIIRIFPMVQ